MTDMITMGIFVNSQNNIDTYPLNNSQKETVACPDVYEFTHMDYAFYCTKKVFSSQTCLSFLMQYQLV